MTDKKLKKCPRCGKLKLYRLLGTGSGIIFKGSGFYETDFKTKKPGKNGKKESAADASEKTTGKPSQKKDSKPGETDSSCTAGNSCACRNDAAAVGSGV